MQRLQRSHRRIDRLLRSLFDTLTLETGRPLRLSASEVALGDRLVWEGRASGWWDRDALYRVIENLLLNAAKYSEPTSPIWARIASSLHGCRQRAHTCQ